MNNEQIKGELKTVFNAIKEIDKQIVNIKVATHTLDKSGYNMSEEYKAIDEVGIEFYKLKTMYQDKIKEMLKNLN